MTGIVIPDGGTIGSASDTDAISISSSGAVTFSQDINPNNFVGMIAPFGMSTPPTGWLACNGSEYAIATYGDLYTAIGTTWGSLTNGSGGAGSTHFKVPDLRGEFLRGWDDGKGTDSGRSFASFQDSQMQAHADHMYQSFSGGDSGATHWIQQNSSGNQSKTHGGTDNNSENRPRNIAVQYCIKY